MSSREKNKFERIRSIAGTRGREMKACLVEIKTGRRDVFRGKARNHSLSESWAQRDASEPGKVSRGLLRGSPKYGPGVWVGLDVFPSLTESEVTGIY